MNQLLSWSPQKPASELATIPKAENENQADNKIMISKHKIQYAERATKRLNSSP